MARSLADYLRGMDSAAIANLLRARPDLFSAHPRTIGELAQLAGEPSSVRSALQRSDVAELATLAACSRLAHVGKVDTQKLADALGVEADVIPTSRLLGRALLWGEPADLHIPIGVRDEVERLQTPPTMQAPPMPIGRSWPQDQIDAAAAHAATTTIQTTRRLLTQLEFWPLPLRTDGLPIVRQLELLQDRLLVSGDELQVLLALVSAAGWTTARSGQIQAHSQVDLSDTDLWAALVRAWLHRSLQEFSWPTNELVIKCYASAPGIQLENLPELAEWHCPLLPVTNPNLRASAGEAASLGLLGMGALSTFGADCLTELSATAANLASGLPARVNTLIVQADATITVTGPLSPPTQRILDANTTLESVGGATVYRLTAASLARTPSDAMPPSELQRVLTEMCPTPLPATVTTALADSVSRKVEARPTVLLTGSPDDVAALVAVADGQVNTVAPGVASTNLTESELELVARYQGIAVGWPVEDTTRASASDRQTPADRLPSPVAWAEALTGISQSRTSPSTPANSADHTSLRDRLLAAIDGRHSLALVAVDDLGEACEATVLPLALVDATFWYTTSAGAIESTALARIRDARPTNN